MTILIFILTAVFMFTWGYMWGNWNIIRIENPSKELKNQLTQVQHQNLRYVHELRILNKRYRRSKLVTRKVQKERDALKRHFGMLESMNVIKTLYTDGNLRHLEGDTE